MIIGAVTYFTPQTGDLLDPCDVSCLTCVPSASMEKICGTPVRVEAKTRWRPSGAQLGFSLRPSLWVSWTYCFDPISITNKLKFPVAMPRVQENAKCCPS